MIGYIASPLGPPGGRVYAIVITMMISAGIGTKLLANNLDQPPAKVEDQAPWTGSDEKPTPCSSRAALTDQLGRRGGHPIQPGSGAAFRVAQNWNRRIRECEHVNGDW